MKAVKVLYRPKLEEIIVNTERESYDLGKQVLSEIMDKLLLSGATPAVLKVKAKPRVEAKKKIVKKIVKKKAKLGIDAAPQKKSLICICKKWGCEIGPFMWVIDKRK